MGRHQDSETSRDFPRFGVLAGDYVNPQPEPTLEPWPRPEPAYYPSVLSGHQAAFCCISDPFLVTESRPLVPTALAAVSLLGSSLPNLLSQRSLCLLLYKG